MALTGLRNASVAKNTAKVYLVAKQLFRITGPPTSSTQHVSYATLMQ